MRNTCQCVDGICSQCGEPVTSVRYCKAGPMGHKAPKGSLLGDRIESALTSIGITQERIKAAMKAIGLPPTCGGCDGHKQKLNNADEWMRELGKNLGQSAVDVISKFYRPLRPKPQPEPPPENVPLA